MDVAVEENLSGFTWSTAIRSLEDPDTVTVDLDTFLIKVEEEVYADSTGQFKIDIPAKSVTLGLDGNGKMDVDADLEFFWFSYGGEIEKFVIQRDGEESTATTIFLDGTAIFEAAAEETSFVLIHSMVVMLMKE